MVELSPDLRARVDAIKGRGRSPQSVQHSRHTAKPWKLTARRVEILQLIADGKTNQEIAEALFLSLETVKTHVRLIMMALEARGRSHAVAISFRRGIIE